MKIIKIVLFESTIIIIAFVFAWIFSLADEVFGLVSFQATWLIIAGIAIMLFGIILRFWAVNTFYVDGVEFLALKVQKSIVKRAPFSFSRNPLMLSNVFVALAAVLIIGSVTGLIIPFTVFLAFHLWIVFYEEKDLEKKFGKEYLDYKNKVRRWL